MLFRRFRHTSPVNLPCFLIEPLVFYHKVKDTEPESPKIIFWKLHAIYGAILTSCARYDVDNVKERRNAGDFAP